MKKSLKNSWIAFGIIILIWDIVWLMVSRAMNSQEPMIYSIFLITGYCIAMNYFLITIVFLTIKRLQKEWKTTK